MVSCRFIIISSYYNKHILRFWSSWNVAELRSLLWAKVKKPWSCLFTQKWIEWITALLSYLESLYSVNFLFQLLIVIMWILTRISIISFGCIYSLECIYFFWIFDIHIFQLILQLTYGQCPSIYARLSSSSSKWQA